MIIITAKCPRISFVTGVVALTTICALGLVVGFVQEPVTQVLSQPQSTLKTTTVKNSKQRLAFLEQWGWEVEQTPLATETLVIPPILDSSYEEYMSLQQAQGFPSLQEFCGAEVIQYSYAVTNYPTGEESVQVNLLCYEDQVIAGEVLSRTLGGFIHGLEVPSS